jgi:omega-hydroxy-beta-dihydromenaquinone-9 sulfotransferase
MRAMLVLSTYTIMYDAYFTDRARIPSGQLVEIAYEDLQRDPIGQLRSIYDGLSLGEFDAIRLEMESYVASIASYKKNRHPALDDATRRRVAEAWSRNFEAWGYPLSTEK